MTNTSKKDSDKTETTRHFQRWRQNDPTVIKPRGVSVVELSMSGFYRFRGGPMGQTVGTNTCEKLMISYRFRIAEHLQVICIFEFHLDFLSIQCYVNHPSEALDLPSKNKNAWTQAVPPFHSVQSVVKRVKAASGSWILNNKGIKYVVCEVRSGSWFTHFSHVLPTSRVVYQLL